MKLKPLLDKILPSAKDVPPKVAYSVVVPVFNEEDSISQLYTELADVFSEIRHSFEIVFVDDGSTDGSSAILDALSSSFPVQVRVIRLPARNGQTFALKQGLNASIGEYVITLDADLQNDPADIPRMVAKLEEGYDVVCAWRRDRRDQPLKTRLSRWGNILQRRLTGLSVHDVSCTLRIYRKTCVSRIPLNWEGQHRFIPLSLALQGFRVGEIEANHRQRRFGVSKYSHKRIGKVVVDFFRILNSQGRQ